MSIFSDMAEDFIEIFMDDFSVFGYLFDHCLNNLNMVLKRCVETNLVLNWKKMSLYGQGRNSVRPQNLS